MRVLYDDQIFRSQRRGGISRYFVELLQAFAKREGTIRCNYPGRWSDNEHAIEAGLAKRLPELPTPHSFAKGRALGQRVLRRTLLGAAGVPRNAGRATDLYHPTFYLRDRCIRTKAPLVVTAYDMIPERLPSLFAENPHYEKSWYLRRASGVIAISQSTADDVKELVPDISASIRVIHLGVDTERFAPHPETSDSRSHRPTVLFVGNRGAYKDFNVLLRAVAHPSLRDTSIVAAGPPGPSEDERAEIADLGLAGRVRFATPSDDELPSLYRDADVFVFPSRYEGFGLPTLEAMACGTPVVLARSSSHPEVGGDAAEYFTPGDSEELAQRIESVLSDTVRRTEMREEGLKRTRQFTWSSVGDQTLRFYREII